MKNWEINTGKQPFDLESFCNYVDSFGGFGTGKDGDYTRKYTKNALEGMAERISSSYDDKLLLFLAEFIGDNVAVDEIAMFCADNTLTGYSREQKWNKICEMIRTEQLDTEDFTEAERQYIANVLWE